MNETMNQTTNRMNFAELKAMNNNLKSQMDFLEWANVIDSLEKAIADSQKSIEINIAFLKTAILHQDKCPKPKPKENTV